MKIACFGYDFFAKFIGAPWHGSRDIISTFPRLRAALLMGVLIISLAFDGACQSERKVIGVQLPLTGPVSSWGLDCKDGLDLVFKEIPPPLLNNLDIVYQDDQVTPKLAVGIAKRFFSDNNLLALVSFSTSVALAISPISLNYQIPFLALSGHPDLIAKNPNVFDHWPDYSIETAQYLEFLREVNPKRIATITYEHDYTLAIRERFNQGALAQGREVVIDETVTGEIDARAIVSRVLRNSPEFIFLNLFEPHFSSLLKALKERRFSGKLLTSSGNITADLLSSMSSAITDGVVFFTPNYQGASEFLGRLANLERKPQDVGNVFACYVGARRLVAGIMNTAATGDLTATRLLTAMREIKEVDLGARKLPVIDRRIQYDFLKGIARNGAIDFVR
jgi:ABC-type branched-subunit amino acid transport system substrate-binding protein